MQLDEITLDDAPEAGPLTKEQDAPVVTDAPSDPPPAEEEASAAEPAEPLEPEEGEEAITEEPEAAAFEAPNHWPKEVKEAWKGVPPEAQSAVGGWMQEVLNTHANTSRELTQWRQFAEPIRNLISPEVWQRMQYAGHQSPASAIAELFEIEQYSRQDPKGYIRAVAQRFGLSPDDIFADDHAEVDADPDITQLRQTVEGISQRFDGFLNQSQQQQRESQTRHIQGYLDQFKAIKDDTGNLSYPYFDQLEPRMTELSQSDSRFRGRQLEGQLLHELYWEALLDHPQLRQQEMEKRAQQQIKEAEKQRKAAAARRARSVTAPAPESVQRSGPQDLDSMIWEGIESAYAG